MVFKHESVTIRLEYLVLLYQISLHSINMKCYINNCYFVAVHVDQCNVLYNIHLKIVNDLEIVKLKVNPSNKDTPLIRTLFPSPMTVRIRGVSLYINNKT